MQFNRITDKPFVKIKQKDGTYKTKNVEIGISDGINVEILEGVTENDEIKVWNIVTDDDNEASREETDEEVED